MARTSRQQRRQRRAQAAGTPPLRPAPRPQQPADEAEAPVERAADVRPEREEPRGGPPGIGFVNESIAELKKVEWPGQHAVVSGTAVVLVACVIVGTYLWLNDQVWQYVVRHVLLR